MFIIQLFTSFYHLLCDAEENVPVISVHAPGIVYRKRMRMDFRGQILVFVLVFARCAVLLYNWGCKCNAGVYNSAGV